MRRRGVADATSSARVGSTCSEEGEDDGREEKRRRHRDRISSSSLGDRSSRRPTRGGGALTATVAGMGAGRHRGEHRSKIVELNEF